MEAKVGQRLGDYEILSLLGVGGMGRVYRVRNTISNRIEAMKILLPDLVSMPDLAARFTAEIRTLAGFDHPNIAQLRTAFQHDNQLIMIMEFLEGVTLETRARKLAIPIAESLDYTTQVLSALSYAHGRGVIHRDLKPANIMVTANSVVKLMDFGIAKSKNELQHTKPGTTMGSIYYMSPEQVTGEAVDARSDIYSLGVTLYELLTGRRPFQADTAFSVLHAQLNAAPQPPIELNASLPPALNNIVLTALAKDPAARFQSADAFRDALHALNIDAAATFIQPPAPAHEQLLAPTVAHLQPDASPSSDPPFTPVSAPAAPPPPRDSHRSLWIGFGAAAALIAMISAATLLPRILSTHATSSGDTTIKAPAQTPVTTSPEQQPASTPQTQSSEQQPASDIPASSSAARTLQPSAPTARAVSVSSDPQVISAAAQEAANPMQPELREASERLLQISSRATAARDSIDQLRRQQEADGLGLRADVASSLSRMNSYLELANRALGSRDIAQANQDMDKAELELGKLETFLGK
jgi:eukaryotic-like serine/threonine-protein kinase